MARTLILPARFGPASLLLLLSLLATAPAAFAQVSTLDKSVLIDGLRREGMTELLLHLAETEPSKDPMVDLQIRIAQHRIRYQRTDRPLPRRSESRDEAIAIMREAIDEHVAHEQRPIIQTDLAEVMLFEYLEGLSRQATAFHDLGVPSADQREAFEKHVPDALAQLADADFRFARLQTELPREKDHTQKRINSGLWDRMMNQYYQLRTQFLLAHLAYHASRLPDDHPYFRDLGSNPRIRDQSDSIDDERGRLLDLVLERIDPLVRSGAGGEAIHRKSILLAGLARSRLGDHEAALGKFEMLIGTGKSTADLTDLFGRLGRARALVGAGRPDDARDLLDALSDHPVARDDLLMRLLVVDAKHRTALSQAKDDPKAVAAAYDLYTRFLAEPSLADDAAGLRGYIYRRWGANLEDGVDLAKLPALVVLAIGQTLREEVQDRIDREIEASEEGIDPDGPVMVEARTRLERCAGILDGLLQRPERSGAIDAGARYNLGWVAFLNDVTNVDAAVEAARAWTAVAAEHADQPDAARAIEQAVMRMRFWHQQPSMRGLVDAAYQDTMKVLLEKYPTSPAADDERYYYAAFVLLPAGKYDEAAEAFAEVPPGHPDYLVARKELLFALLAIHRADPGNPEGETVQRRARRIRSEAKRLHAAAERALTQASGEAADRAHNSVGGAHLALAELALIEGKPQEALDALDKLIQEHADDELIMGDALSRRIFALAAASRLDEAVDEARGMMGQFPEQASAVIDTILTELDREADRLRGQAAESLVQSRREQLTRRADGLAQASSQLARLLLDWAGEQDFDEEQMLPFRLIAIKSLRLAGNAEQAMQQLAPVLEAFGDDAIVIHHAGETLYALGGRENRIGKAAEQFKRIILSYPEPPFPAIYWNAWMRWFQISDEFGEHTADIPLRVSALRRSDPNLGGEPYRTQMQRLANKHAQ